ncbi:hypothetical protein HJC99_05860 [Candidatus Saccharibacteria bacterium]|nr:hypothetical protein [Candidatus Saccharibacteria bacterium]
MRKLDRLLAREMDRREFLVTVGLGIVSLFGLSALMGILSRNEPENGSLADYGMRDYGP